MELTREKLYALIAEVVGEQIAPLKESTSQQNSWLQSLIGNRLQEKEVEVPKGQTLARILRALAAGKGDPIRAAAWAEKQWKDSNVAKALAAGDATAGGFLVPEAMSAEIIELLRPMSVVRRMNPIVIPMDTGTLRLPTISGGANASYVGENVNITKTEPTFGQVVLTFKKLAALVPISNDLLRMPTVGADTIVRDDLVAAIAEREDLAFIRDNGTADTPKGLRFFAPAANLINVNATVNLANITGDLVNLVLALRNNNVRMLRPGWLWAPRTEMFLATIRDGNGNYAFRDEMMQRGTFWGWPFAATTQIPINLAVTDTAESEIYLVDFADAVIGDFTSLILDASGEAAYNDGTNVVAAFSLDQTVVRAIAQHDFVMRHNPSVAVLIDVDWTA